jgi:thiol-disulfide isomerase/thioredoxin
VSGHPEDSVAKEFMKINRMESKQKRFWTPLRVALTILVFSLLAVAGISSCKSSDDHSSTPAPAAKAPGQPLPDNVRTTKVRAAGGGTISLGDYSGKVLVVNLWATWCPPCRQETPELVRLYKEYRSKGVEMVGLTNESDPRETPERVDKYVNEFQVEYHIAWAPVEVLSAFYDLEPQRNAIPQSYVISRDGRVMKKFVGFNPMTTPPAFKQAIEDALQN